MTDTPKQIYLVGSHPDSFIEKLSAEGYNVTRFDSYASIKSKAARPTAIITLGHDDDFADVTEIKSLLHSNVVLAVFAPSPSLLKCLHEALETVIDIERMEIFDGVPLIIRRMPEDGTIYISAPTIDDSETHQEATDHVNDPSYNNSDPDLETVSDPAGVPPVSSADLAQEAIETPLDLALRTSVFSLRKAIEFTSEDSTSPDVSFRSVDSTNSPAAVGLLSGGVGLSVSMTNRLMPPPHTRFFKKVVLSRQFAYKPNGYTVLNFHPGDFQGFLFDWVVTLYCYATQADPTKPDFEKNNGEVYVIALHSGNIVRDPSCDGRPDGNWQMYRWFIDSVQFGGEFRSLPLIRTTAYPSTESQPVVNHRYEYSYQYTESVNLWSENHKAAYDLQIAESFSRQDFKQTVSKRDNKYSFSVDYKKEYVAKDGGNGKDAVIAPGTSLSSAYDFRKENFPLPEDNIEIHGLFVAVSRLGKGDFVTTLNARFLWFHFPGRVAMPSIKKNYSKQTKIIPLDLTFKA